VQRVPAGHELISWDGEQVVRQAPPKQVVSAPQAESTHDAQASAGATQVCTWPEAPQRVAPGAHEFWQQVPLTQTSVRLHSLVSSQVLQLFGTGTQLSTLAPLQRTWPSVHAPAQLWQAPATHSSPAWQACESCQAEHPWPSATQVWMLLPEQRTWPGVHAWHELHVPPPQVSLAAQLVCCQVVQPVASATQVCAVLLLMHCWVPAVHAVLHATQLLTDGLQSRP
jgi:hypothetical protein